MAEKSRISKNVKELGIQDDYTSITLSAIQFLLAIYLIIVVFKGKTYDLIEFFKDCSDFGVYVFAWLVLVGVYELFRMNKELYAIVRMFIPLIIVGYVLYTWENIRNEFNKLFNYLKTKGGKK